MPRAKKPKVETLPDAVFMNVRPGGFTSRHTETIFYRLNQWDLSAPANPNAKGKRALLYADRLQAAYRYLWERQFRLLP